MKITLNLWAGPNYRKWVTKEDIGKNIDALHRAIAGEKQTRDDVLLHDTITILEAIEEQLPDPTPSPHWPKK